MYTNPLPVQESMTKEEIENIKITEWGWRKSAENFVCAVCGEPAYSHPLTDEVWGCKKCGFTTYSLSVFFRPLPKPELAQI